MAIWQWDCIMVPRKRVLDFFDVIPEYIEIDWFDQIDWWNEQSPSEIENFWDVRLPRYDAPWEPLTLNWGEESGTRIRLTVNRGTVKDITIRIDLRNLSHELLQTLVAFANSYRGIFYGVERQGFIAAQTPNLIAAIESSRKMTFVQDPNKFFSENKRFLDALNKPKLTSDENNKD